MNEAYIRFLCENPFLINESFWNTIDEKQAGIRKWKSFRNMTEQFRLYCQAREISEEIYKSYYFNFQTLAYGAAFVIVNGLLLEGGDPGRDILDLEERIYRNLEQSVAPAFYTSRLFEGLKHDRPNLPGTGTGASPYTCKTRWKNGWGWQTPALLRSVSQSCSVLSKVFWRIPFYSLRYRLSATCRGSR